MGNTVIKIENLSKEYYVGEVGTGTLSHDFHRWWAKMRGLEDPYSPVGGDDKPSVHNNTGYVWALRDISLDIREGEVLGIIGRNGAGKSTLLRIISRITAPTRGTVKVKGRVASLLEVGTGMHPELTGRENIYLNGAILGMKQHEIDTRLDEIIEFSGCTRYIDTPIKRYSSGMRVRLGFAVAAFLEAEILIVDEVLAVGDAVFQKKCINKMGDIASGGRTVLFVSHRMEVIRRLCTSAIVIDDGRIACTGDANRAIDHYLHDTDLHACGGDRGPDRERSIRIRNTRLLNADNELSMTFSRSDSAFLEISYDVNKKVDGCHIFVKVLNNEEMTIFSTGDCDLDNSLYQERKPGFYISRCELPVNLLNEGEYFVSITASVPFGDIYDSVSDAVRFNVHDTDSDNRPEYLQTRPGLVVQDIAWKTEKADTSATNSNRGFPG